MSKKNGSGSSIDYEQYRWFFTSSNKVVIGGKSAEQNEKIMRRAQPDDIIMHTSTPGSPFCIIKKPNKKDMGEVAIFTACFSQEWKKRKKKAEVHIFKGEQVIKKNTMKQGTFGIMGSVDKKKVELKLALDIQKGKLRAVPLSVAKKKLVTLAPGSLDKVKAVNKIADILKNKYSYPVTRDEIASAIPAGNISIK